MSRHLTREVIDQAAMVHGELLLPVTVDRTFELPRALYVATVALYLGFLATMAAGFRSPELAIPMAIFAVVVLAGFGVPALWVRMRPDNAAEAMGWQRFGRDGIATHTGRLTAGEATAQMLVLPVLIFLWGIACVTIAALT